MCGIAGIVGENPSEEELDKMLFTQRHRGPDFTGKFCAKFIALGHNRLSILDLSAAANQPFFSDDKRYVLVLNGEIYNYLELKNELKNYPFKTASDTEVLLAAYIKWGEDCLHKLNGMFSFAIWDTHTNCIFAARDRFGVKPFYYFKKKDKLYFASEIKTLLAGGIPKKTNDKVWANYFVYGSYGMPDETFFEGIHQLPGGHFLKLHKNQLSIKKWYFFEDEIKKYQKKISFNQAKKEYNELLESSIKLRFRADVPIGFNIIGGVDSGCLRIKET
ncbi:asparagine synthetase B [Seonamhaeicola sp.]|uniref:asparagine synthetase B family protein n=1 Tax=Seonamhaeicola sp. TaxID=1912245 RepID=UPI0035655AC2